MLSISQLDLILNNFFNDNEFQIIFIEKLSEGNINITYLINLRIENKTSNYILQKIKREYFSRICLPLFQYI